MILDTWCQSGQVILTIPPGSVLQSLDHSFPSQLSFNLSQSPPLTIKTSQNFSQCLFIDVRITHCWSIHSCARFTTLNSQSGERWNDCDPDLWQQWRNPPLNTCNNSSPASKPSTFSLNSIPYYLKQRKTITEGFLTDYHWFSQFFLSFRNQWMLQSHCCSIHLLGKIADENVGAIFSWHGSWASNLSETR